jgi:hypothetical protein
VQDMISKETLTISIVGHLREVSKTGINGDRGPLKVDAGPFPARKYKFTTYGARTTRAINVLVDRGTYDRLSVHKLDGTFFNIDYIAYTSPQKDICVLKTKEKYNLAFLSLSSVDPVEGESIVVIENSGGVDRDNLPSGSFPPCALAA